MGASSTDSRGWLAQHGADGFKRNIENHPWRRVGDARFDGLSKAIFQKVLEGDERAMNWDDDMQQVVGLWDQVIHGDIEEDQMVKKDPMKQWAIGKLFSAVTDVDNLIDKCRRYAHTRQRGKSREDAIEEFIAIAERLFAKFGEPIPPPTPLPQGDQASMVSSEETEEDEEVYGKVEYKALEVGERHKAIAADAQSETTSESTGVALFSSADSSATVSQETGLAAWDPRNMLSKEWWTPQRGFLVAGATGLAVALTAGGIYLANMFIRRKQKAKGQRKRRAHARSWNIVDVNSGEIPVRLHM